MDRHASWRWNLSSSLKVTISLLLAFSLPGCGETAASTPDLAILPDSSADLARPDMPQKPDSGAPDAEVPLTWRACDTSRWPTGYPKPSAAIECTVIVAPLDHANPTGPTIALTVARQKSKAFPTGKAVFNLAGGPGGTSVGQSGTIPYFLPGLQDDFDMIYVDQRGTGGSGYLDCSKGYPSTEAEWTVCAAEHTGSKLDHYLTVDAAHDLELVRKRLGYAKIHVRGGSYGTRLALELIRQHESSLAAVVLDGVAPPEWDIFGYDVGALDAALKLLADDCGKSAACLAVSPSFAADLEARRLALKASPRKIVVNGTSMLEDDQTFAAFLFAAVDRTATRYRIPRAVHLAVEGDSSVWDTLVSDATGYLVKGAADPPSAGLVGFRPRRPHQRGVSYVAPGLFATVVCAEWLPNSGGVAALQASLAKQTWGDSGMVDLAKACAAWKLSPLAAALRAPVSTKVKTLLLSGEIDIRTPPEMGTLAAKTLSNSQHLVVPYASHSTISVACAAKILTAFFKADGELASLDSSCLKSVPQPAW